MAGSTDTNKFLDLFPGNHIFVSKPDKETGVPWHYHEEYETAKNKLKEREMFGWGSFFAVNFLDRSKDAGTEEKPKHRTKRMFKKARAVFLDFDHPDKPIPKFPLKPSITVNSSPGKYQFYWLTETEDTDEWNKVMECLVQNYHGDPQAKDLARILRLPGYNHNKTDIPFMVTYEIHSATIINWKKIAKHFPPLATTVPSTQDKSTLPSGTDFNSIDAISQILKAENYHGALTSLAMRYVNKNMERDEILTVLRGMGAQAKRREEWEMRFSDQHLYECIDSAIIKKAQEDLTGAAGVPDLREVRASIKIPKFPTNVLDNWPDPWPMLWKNYKVLPRTLDECLLIPTILTTQSFYLSGRYINEWGKRPNMAFLAIAPSTGNKDVNSKDVIETIREIMVRKNKNYFFFTKILSYPESITADSAFIQAFDDSGDMFWLNTEATYIFHQLATSRNNAAMKAIESKLIEVVDGGAIHGKRKASEALKTIDDPNVQVLFYCQPETVREYLQDSIIDSGLLGRFMIHIPEIDTKDPFLNSFIRRSDEQQDLCDEFIKYFTQQQQKNTNKIQLKPTQEDLDKLQNWMMTTVKDMTKGEQDIKLLRRLAISAEQLYTVILGTMRHWDFLHERDLREDFDIECVIPLLTYWAKCKVYALREFVSESIDPLADQIYEILAKLITGQIKSKKYAHVIKKFNAVPRTEIDRVIQSRGKLIKLLDVRSDMRNVRVRTHQLLDMWVRNGTMVEIALGRKKLIGFTKDEDEVLP